MDPQYFMAFGYKTAPSKIDATISSLQRKIEHSAIEVPVSQPHILNSIGLRKAPNPLDVKKRTVGLTPAQNQFAQTQAILAKGRDGLIARINQRDADYFLDSETGQKALKTTSRGRPDLNIVHEDGVSIKTEFDRPPASRAPYHAQQQLDANPDAVIWLLTLDKLDESSELWKVIKANRDGVDNYVASLREGT